MTRLSGGPETRSAQRKKKETTEIHDRQPARRGGKGCDDMVHPSHAGNMPPWFQFEKGKNAGIGNGRNQQPAIIQNSKSRAVKCLQWRVFT